MKPQEPQQPVPVTDIRQDLALFDAVFGLPAARLQVDTSMAGSASPWLASGEEVEDAEIVHAVAPDAAIRVVLIPSRSSPGEPSPPRTPCCGWPCRKARSSRSAPAPARVAIPRPRWPA